MPTILTRGQVAILQRDVTRARATRGFDADIERRRGVGQRFRLLLESSGLLEGRDPSRDTVAQLIRLEKQIQNLNSMQLPKLLGSSHYARFFQEFSGDDAAFARHMAATRTGWTPGFVGYPGADLPSLGRDLRGALAGDGREWSSALARLMEQPGIGSGFASGLLYLFDPSQFALVNGASRAPFRGEGEIALSRAQRATLRRQVRESYGTELPDHAERLIEWLLFFRDVREVAGVDDFHQLDLALWMMANGFPDRVILPDDTERVPAITPATLELLRGAIHAAGDDYEANIRVRREAEDAARQILDRRAGAMSADDVRQLFALLNRNWGRGHSQENRFAKSMTGIVVKECIDALETFNLWVKRLWSAPVDEANRQLDAFWHEDPIRLAGRALPTAVLHLRDSDRWPYYLPALVKGAAHLAGGALPARAMRRAAAYDMFAAFVARVRHELGTPAVMDDWLLWQASELADGGTGPEPLPPISPDATRVFRGFSDETFRALSEIADRGSTEWMSANGERFRNEVREPLRALVTDVGREFISVIAPDFETEAKSPQMLSSIRKNVWGRRDRGAYWPHYWAAFHRRSLKKTEDFQLFVFLHGEHAEFGFSAGSAPQPDRERLVQQVNSRHDIASSFIEQARDLGLVFHCDDRDGQGRFLQVSTVAELASFLEESRPSIQRRYARGDAALRTPGLVDEVIAVFRAVYPLFLLGTAVDPDAALRDYTKSIERMTNRRSRSEPDDDDDSVDIYTEDQLASDTGLPRDRIHLVHQLLLDKGQVIFYGPPGTGKTWLAQHVARWFATTDENVRTVQFHPSYGYEDFVEGLRPVVDIQGRLQYEVRPGIFLRLCAEARSQPHSKFVLVIDEINRGNLPRIFGEALSLLELNYRDRATYLAVSGTPFTVPRNVFVIGTMNTADQSIALLDAALRRRFHFVRFDPDPALLRTWLSQHAQEWTGVATLLERLNDALVTRGLDPNRLIGHSHFMRPDLDDDVLERIWEHSILPTVEEFFYGQPEVVAEFTWSRYEGFTERDAGGELPDQTAAVSAPVIGEDDLDRDD